jgi:transcriptional regulator with GAF, ATPase, and Fis domain
VLESGVYLPLGAERELRVDVRVVAATNADLDRKIAEASFRPDLYYRLARFTVRTPPLRERTEDIPLLAGHFLELFAREMNRKPPPLTAAALAALEGYDFPGNVRELKNVIERALIQSGARPSDPSICTCPSASDRRRPGGVRRHSSMGCRSTWSRPRWS